MPEHLKGSLTAHPHGSTMRLNDSGVSPMSDQILDHCLLSLHRRKVQWCKARRRVPHIHVEALGDSGDSEGNATGGCCHVQRSTAGVGVAGEVREVGVVEDLQG